MIETIAPLCAWIGFQRHERPVRSGRAPAGAPGTRKCPAFICASAQAAPPPANIA